MLEYLKNVRDKDRELTRRGRPAAPSTHIHPAQPSRRSSLTRVRAQVLRGHKVEDYCGIQSLCFHPSQPWLFTSGADNTARLYVN